MRNGYRSCFSLLALSVPLLLSSCATTGSSYSQEGSSGGYASSYTPNYGSRMPSSIDSSGKVVVVNPRVHAWGAYENGALVRSGQATAGSDWCPDLGRPCRTAVGQFRISSLGNPECKSRTFPIPKGGAPMPYCMYFHGGQALHGVHEGEVVDGNISHGCVRMHIPDAEWLRNNFAQVGTKVIVQPYD